MKNSIQNLRRIGILAVNLVCLGGVVATATVTPAQAAFNTNILTMNAAPIIGSFSPNSGPFLGNVNIYGTELLGVTSVNFNGTSAAFTIISPTHIQATVPAGATLGKLSVTSPNGTFTSTTDFTPYLTWTGTVNNSWDNNMNWANNILPDQNTNIVINSGTSNSPLINTNAVCNNLTIGTGASLALVAGADLVVSGVFSNLGSYTQSGGRINFAAPSGLQQVPALTYHDLTISGSGEKRIQGNSTINGTLEIISSNLTTFDPANTTLTLNGTITGETNDHRFIGKLVKSVPVNGVVANTFGNIGISFVNSGGGNWGNVMATRVTGRSVKNPADLSKESILRYWTISPDVEAGTTVNLTLTWLSAENNNLAFTGNLAQAWRSTDNGMNWSRVDEMKVINTTSASRSISVTTTAFSMWAVSDEANPLPVSWLHFNGKATTAGNQLTWATATEKNTNNFVVERSANGRNFEAIGTVNAGGNSNQQLNYTFTDRNAPAGISYYRLRQNDLDKTFAYSSVISISAKDRNANMEVVAYPNPFDQNLKLQVSNLQAGEVSLMTLTGQQIYRKALAAGNGSETLSLDDLPTLKPGMYLLKLNSGDQQTIIKVNKQ